LVWQIELTGSAEKELAKGDKPVAKRIIRFLRERVSMDPGSSGKALQGDHSGLWRYRIGDCRVICEIYNEKVSVLERKNRSVHGVHEDFEHRPTQ